MDRDTFWRLAQEALSEAMNECGYTTEIYESTREHMYWLPNYSFSEWGIMFLDGEGTTGMYSVSISNSLSEEETKQEFKRNLLFHYHNMNWRKGRPPIES